MDMSVTLLSAEVLFTTRRSRRMHPRPGSLPSRQTRDARYQATVNTAIYAQVASGVLL